MPAWCELSGAQYPALRRYLELLGDSSPSCEALSAEEQAGEYEAGNVRLDGELWRIRTARITPSKPGAFVAFWQRDELGATRPFMASDQMAGLLVFVEHGDRFGVFRFTAAHLGELGVTRSEGLDGKRGFRLYPAWSSGLNAQAARTQAAQKSAFRQLS